MAAPHPQPLSSFAPPVLSTPDSHIFEDPTPSPAAVAARDRPSDEQLHITYEVARTIAEIREGRWRRIALQFPDEMLGDAPRVYQALARGLEPARRKSLASSNDAVVDGVKNLSLEEEAEPRRELSILGDTPYGACCVDEVAAEHVAADVVVHYGRSCLSPTSKLPVMYVFTVRPLDIAAATEAFKSAFPDRNDKIVLMGDIPFAMHIREIEQRLRAEGYQNIFATSVIHDRLSPLPNRTVPEEAVASKARLKEYHLFHIGPPPTALLLTLSSRVASTHIYDGNPGQAAREPLLVTSTQALRRRYALITSLSAVATFGILINTLSVKNYLDIVEHVKREIAAAGKKSYTFVVGKINAAKLANFSEIGGWVVIGCWESSLVESKDFFRPLITPFELELVLKSDQNRIWTGEWSSEFQAVLRDAGSASRHAEDDTGVAKAADKAATEEVDGDSEEDSAPPEFDLRTGRYVSHARPMRTRKVGPAPSATSAAVGTIIRRPDGELAQVGGVVSLGAEYLRSERSWQGLGSDFEVASGGDQGAPMEQGRSGIARGYGEDGQT